MVLRRALRSDPDRRLPLDRLLHELDRIHGSATRAKRRRRRTLATVGVGLLFAAAGSLLGASFERRRATTSELRAGRSSLPPLVRAKLAARAGDEAAAISLRHQIDRRAHTLSPAELEEAAESAARIAAILEDAESKDALLARAFADYLERL